MALLVVLSFAGFALAGDSGEKVDGIRRRLGADLRSASLKALLGDVGEALRLVDADSERCVLDLMEVASSLGHEERANETNDVRLALKATLRHASKDARRGEIQEALDGVFDALTTLQAASEGLCAEQLSDLGSQSVAPATEMGPPPGPVAKVGKPHAQKPHAQKSYAAVDAALRWLAAHQSPNGGWEASGFSQWCDHRPVGDASKRPDGAGKALYNVGVTGLALKAFLNAGYTHRGTHAFTDVVSRALRYLVSVQDSDGCFGRRSTQQYIYNHATAALALITAYGMTGAGSLKEPAQRALAFVNLARNPWFAWRYGIKPGDNDTSVSGWMVAVINAAEAANSRARLRGEEEPFEMDGEAWKGILAWLKRVTDLPTGRVGYVQPGTGPARPAGLVDRFPGIKSESMTAVNILALLSAGVATRDTRITKGAALCNGLPPRWDPTNGSIDMYYWYYATLALSKLGGRQWSAWRSWLRTAVVAHQRRDTNPCQYKGSWDPIGPWGPDGGRVYSTALMAMVLTAYYRTP